MCGSMWNHGKRVIVNFYDAHRIEVVFFSSAVMEQYVLQVMGEVSYISGETELILFKDIRRLSLKNFNHFITTTKPNI